MDRASDAFVIWIDAAGSPGPGLVGRIEHVQTAERGRFGSAEELLAFVAAHCGGASSKEEDA